LPDKFIDHGDSVTLLKGVGLDGVGIEASIRARFASDAPLLKAIV
jgi:deoxyxylulose-5-phosphate synthase